MADQPMNSQSTSSQDHIMSDAIMSVKLKDNADPSLVDILPSEIIREVFKYLWHEDIPHFRLTCKTCAVAGMQQLVHTLYLIYTKESFLNLLNISRHPELSRYVRYITYAPRIVGVIKNEWRHILELRAQSDFTALDGAIIEQRSMEEENFSTSIFSQVFSNFSGLKKLQICVSNRSLRFPLDPKPFSVTIQDRRMSSEKAQEVLDAVSKAGTKLECLILQSVSSNIMLGISISAGTISPTSNWSYLRELHISISRNFLNEGISGLVQVLRTTYNVQNLSIGVEGCGTPSIDWAEVALGVTLPCLRSMEIHFMMGSSISLTGFLQRHAETLRSLRMPYCRLQGPFGEWSKIFDIIRNDMTLKEVSFMNHLESTEDPAINILQANNIPLHCTYFGHDFWLLLEDRLLNRNAVAKECNLTSGALWDGYVAYVISGYQETLLRYDELYSAVKSKRELNENDRRLAEFLHYML